VIHWDQLELSRRRPALRWVAANLAYEAFPQFTLRVLEITAARLCAPRIPEIFSRDLHEIPPTLNDDLLDLFGRCERTLSNQFTFLAHSEEFPEEIDWTLHQGTAWAAEMHSFDFSLDLALNYRISGDLRYARHLRYLMAHWIAANPPGEGDGWSLPPLARRARNWVLASDLARRDWESDELFFSLINRSLALQAQILFLLRGSLSSTEAKLDAALALTLAGKFFGRKHGAELTASGSEILSSVLDGNFDFSGRLTQSHPGTLLRLANAIEEYLIFQAGQNLNESGLKNKLVKILGGLAGTLLPDGSLPLFGGSTAPIGDELADTFALAAVILNEPAWKNLAGKFGVVPYMFLGEAGLAQFKNLTETSWSPVTCLQPQAGVFRLGGTDSSAMVINGRLPVSSSDHQDGLSYEFELHGQRVVVDSGVLFPEPESQEHYFATARAHNVLLVDGIGPHPAVDDSLPSPARVGKPEDKTFGLRLAHRGFSSQGIAHQRAWYRLEDNCWAVLDWLDALGSHQGTSLIHFYPTFDLEIGESSAIARSRSLTLSVIPLGHPCPEMVASHGQDEAFEGWYSPTIGMKYASGVLRFEWEITSWPWCGGYLIVPGAEHDFKPYDSGGSSAEVRFRLQGKEYRLSPAGGATPWQKVD
jgi:Heparinase II/III-like protein